MSKKEVDDVSGTETTGHDWDGIKELNTPLPRWWLGILYACIAWAIGYWIVYPAWPTLNGYTPGLLNHSQRDEVMSDVATLKSARAAREQDLVKSSLSDIQQNPDRLQFAMAAGKAVFGDNCVGCHGAGGQGAKGYPNLNDDVWLWGGKLADIEHTITVGVRSTHAGTRQSMMPAFGRDGIIKEAQVEDLTEYVLKLSGRKADPKAIARAAPLFTDNCAACHGADAKGNRSLGAPNLTDNETLYGAGRENIREQIWSGHGGVMPAWNTRLSPQEIKALAVYVHNLGGGE